MTKSEPTPETSRRKEEHLDLVLAGVGRPTCGTGFDGVRFRHVALPELKHDDIDLSTVFLGKRLLAPLLISSMTGGPTRAALINRNLAEAAEALGIAFAVGSQRVSLEGGAAEGLGRELRKLAPTIPILANIGGAQLAKGWGVTEAQRAVDAVEADALIVHLNPLQEVLQPEGDRDWRGVTEGIQGLTANLAVPVIVKETGCGLSGPIVRRLFEIGVAGVDLAGAGGTNWGLIEGARGSKRQAQVASAFSSWGVPTAQSIIEARCASPTGLVIASGGVRDGVDVAKAIRLGADIVGQAAAVLPAALQSVEAVMEHFGMVNSQLQTVCFCTGSGSLKDLRVAQLDGLGFDRRI